MVASYGQFFSIFAMIHRKAPQGIQTLRDSAAGKGQVA
jgi:hypothetical protein